MQSLKKAIAHKEFEKGFTLIEMAIVMIIFGIIVASSATAYVQWQKWLRFETTQNNVATATTAIENFLLQNGRYPCPASLDAQRTDGNAYGIEPDSAAGLDCETVATSNIDTLGSPTGNDIFVVAGARSGAFLTPGTGAANTGTSQVRIGAIPFRNLGLPEEQAYDGYRNRLYYAVTEHLASSASYEQDTGRINVQDLAGDSLTTTAGNVHYIVFSVGESGAGGFTREGTLLACPTSPAVENENCDFNDATFLVDNFSTSNDNNRLDDVISFGAAEVPKWERPQGADPNDGIATGSLVGLGPAASTNPTEEMDVSGVIRAQDDPLTPEIEGQIKTRELCVNANPTDPNCFDVSAITGLLADGEGMECTNPNEFIVGIQNNSPVCEVVNIGCPGNQMIIGIDSNGVVDCGDPPPVGCPTQPVNNCGDTRNLLAAPHGDTQTLTFGTNVGNLYTQVFQCNAGAWNLLSTTGLCSCTPNVWNVQNNVSCADSDNNPCGSRYSGDLDRQTQRVCPSGNVNTVITRNGCVCQNTWGPDTTRSCATHWFRGLVPTQPPSGYSWNTGNVTAAREHVCSSTTSGSCSGYQYQSDNCGCSNGTPYQVVRACSNGAPADEIVTRQFVCNGGGGVGDYGQDVQISVDTTACTCPVGSTPGTPRACTSPTVPIAPHTGVPTTVTWSSPGPGVCTSVTTEDGPESSYCEAPPPLTCVWKRKTGALPIAGTAILTHGVDSCDCSADAGVEPLCSQGGQAYTCSCQVN